MTKALVVAVLVMLITAVCGFAETGIGATAQYPIFAMQQLGEFDTDYFMVGANLRFKKSLLLLDFSGLYQLNGGSVGSIADIGLCLDILLFRLSLLGGADAIYFMESGDFLWGFNAKANVDLKLGPATIGLSGVYPLTAHTTGDNDTTDGMLLFYALSINVLLWF